MKEDMKGGGMMGAIKMLDIFQTSTQRILREQWKNE
jgi:hypothetical protein